MWTGRVDDRRDARVAAVAARQRGSVTLAQARDAGVTEAALRHRLATGRWIRVHAKVFRIAGAEVTTEQQLLAACFHLGPTAVASHASAAWLWELDGFERPPPRLELTVVGTSSRRAGSALLVHRTRISTLADRATVRGIPVTSVPRTLVDLGSSCAPRRVEGARDAAHREGLVSLRREEAQLRRPTYLPGAAVLRGLVAADDGDPPAQSVLERQVLRALAARGVPTPARQHRVTIAGTRYRFDAAWPDHRVAVEAWSRRWHSGRRKAVADVVRLGDAASEGWLVVTAVREDELDGGRRLIRQVVGALRAHGAPLS
jgi:hypothetical protein